MSVSFDTCRNPIGAASTLFLTGLQSLVQLACDIGDPNIYPNDAQPKAEYDFIVIGGGSAGSVVANRLSAVGDWDILLLESKGLPPYTSEVPRLTDTLARTSITWEYRTDGTGDYCLGMEDNKCIWPRGRILGGSSVLNEMVYLRGHPEDYSKWVKDGNGGWGYEDLIPFFEKAESQAEEYGDVGHLHLEPFDGGMSTGELPLLKPLKRSAEELGYRATLDASILSNPGYFNTYGTVRNGTRINAAKAYLVPVKSRGNLDVADNVQALKIIFNSKKRATGVQIDNAGTISTVTARKEVILSAGTIGSPRLLMHSGIGPQDSLTNLGIPIVAALPVGDNLQDHVMFPGVVVSIDRDVCRPFDPRKTIMRNVVDYLLLRKGPLTGIGYNQYVGFIPRNHSKPFSQPDIQIFFAFFDKGDISSMTTVVQALGYKPEVISNFTSLVNESDTLFAIPVILHPKSRGQVRLTSSDFIIPPNITPNYFDHPADEDAMLRGIEEAMKILTTGSMKHAHRIEPRALVKDCLRKKHRHKAGKPSSSGDIDDSPLMTGDYWRCAMRKLATTDTHASGTCKMGPNKEDSVVDCNLKVHSVKRLRVIDSSVKPFIHSGKSNGPVYAIAEKGASMIIEDWVNTSH